MPSEKRKYNPKKVRRNYTYSVEDIAELLGVSAMTVFRWISEEGLKRIPETKKYFVHGSHLIEFLIKKNIKNKKPCQDGEIYCCKCRKPRNPHAHSLKFKKLSNQTVRISGKCGVCAAAINKVVSGKKWNETHPLYPNINADIRQHNGESESQHKCKDRRDG